MGGGGIDLTIWLFVFNSIGGGDAGGKISALDAVAKI